ncbi:TIGR04255 family protein [Streptomyces sp. TM32]|uniref:TIGR04255 family protein n=1 Tax=Streptomyces sp. TM32 TaxID=1652669 RepID=UPI001013887C|nr:TIGR04255 family protein [Streptomyces sp. TM32]RXS67308.1 TIGR04255 family protein [Streptomyces sp. TM32]
MYPGREVFLHAPLVYVTAEITLSYEPRVNQPAVRDAFAEGVRQRFPLLQQERALAVKLEEVDEDIPPQVLPAIRAFTADSEASALLKASALTVDTTAYAQFENFDALLRVALTALAESVPGAMVRRVGVRYVNEIRVPGETTADPDWPKWVSESLLAGQGLLPSGHAAGSMGHVLFHLKDDYWTGFRYGDVIGTTIVDRDVAVRRKKSAEPENSRFFALDIDSFWDPSEPVKFDPDQIAQICDRLHRPAGELFQASITERARKHFRGDSHE